MLDFLTEHERQVSGAADSGSDAGADAGSRRLQALVRLVPGALSGQLFKQLHQSTQSYMPHDAFEIDLDSLPEYFRSDDTESKLLPGSVKARLR
jgi:hypothetical protein